MEEDALNVLFNLFAFTWKTCLSGVYFFIREVYPMKLTTKNIVIMALLIAISVVLVYLIHFPIFPTASYLEYDPADIPILIGAFAFGPVAGIIITVIASAIQALTVSAHSGIYGFIMHVIATSTLVIVASVIYRVKHTRVGAVIGLISGTLAMAGIMMVANHFITPFYMGAPTEVVDALLIPIILPFNLIKAGINSAVTFLVYKAVSKYIIHGEKFGSKKNSAGQST
jgi:riboflavin transporter FmnP